MAVDTKTGEAHDLVADVGGTNTRLALTIGETLCKKTVRRYRNKDFENFENLLNKYLLDEAAQLPSAMCIAVAGPVHEGRATLTNLDWSFCASDLAALTSSGSCLVLNDLQAQGHALQHLSSEHIKTVFGRHTVNATGTRLMIGVGTGFNSAPVFDVGSKVIVQPSETGHANLPIRTAFDFELSRVLTDTHGFPAIEEVLSGRGLERLYDVLGRDEPTHNPKSAAEIMSSCGAGGDQTSCEAAKNFTRILGAVCGNLSLIQLPLGGVFLVGGVSRAFAPYLQLFGFQDAFRDMGRFSEFMDQFSVHIIEDDYAALIGCASQLNKSKATNEAVV